MQATKLFASNCNSRMAQRFYNLVLLPAIQYDIREHEKLNFHLYLALKKALSLPPPNDLIPPHLPGIDLETPDCCRMLTALICGR